MESTGKNPSGVPQKPDAVMELGVISKEVQAEFELLKSSIEGKKTKIRENESKL